MSESKIPLLTNPRNIVRLPIASVTPSPHHSRVHNRKKRHKLEKLLEQFGQVTPIIVDQDYFIVDGHAVHAALKSRGCREVMAIVVSNCGPAEIRALRLALNRIVYDAKWDDEACAPSSGNSSPLALT